MSAELERDLRKAFSRLPRPGADVTARAKEAALAAVPESRRRRAGRLVVVLAAVAAATAIAAAALAARGQLHIAVGAKRQPAAPAPTHLTVPAGTHGLALVAGGRLWLATRGGLRIEGMPVTAAELSPRALYAVVGIGSSLVALAPGRRRAWTHAVPGRVVSASWSPDGLKIAYVVATARGAQLRVIEGDGDHDRVLDRHAAQAKPLWRHDSLAVVYERADGRGSVLDLGRGVRRPARPPAAATGWARSPRGDDVALAVRTRGQQVELRVVRRRGAPAPNRIVLRVRAPAGPLTVSWR